MEIYTCSATGTGETLRRTGYSGEFSGTAIQHVEFGIVDANSYAMLATDRLVVKVYAARVSGPATCNITVYFDGIEHGATIETTIIAPIVVGTTAGTFAAGDDARIVGAIQSSVLTTNEDILIRRGGVPARLPKGTTEGMVPRMTGGVIVWTVLSFTLALCGDPCMTPIAQQGSPARTT